MIYSCIGFSDNDKALIKKQFDVLKNKIAQQWSYETDAEHYNLLLVKGNLKKPVSSNLTIVVEGEASADNELPASWPLRIFDLLDFIQQAESTPDASTNQIPKVAKQSSYFSTANMIKEYLDENDQPLILAIADNDYICVDPGRKKVLMTKNKTLETLQAMLQLNESELKILSANHIAQIKWKAAKPLKSFLWSLALRENAIGIYGWDIQRHSFQLNRFPSLGEWESPPFMLRLASLYSRRNCTIKMAMDFANIDEAQVASFLHACNMVDAGLITKYVKVSNAPTSNKQQTEKYNSMFGQVRSKLGTVFGKLING